MKVNCADQRDYKIDCVGYKIGTHLSRVLKKMDTFMDCKKRGAGYFAHPPMSIFGQNSTPSIMQYT